MKVYKFTAQLIPKIKLNSATETIEQKLFEKKILMNLKQQQFSLLLLYLSPICSAHIVLSIFKISTLHETKKCNNRIKQGYNP